MQSKPLSPPRRCNRTTLLLLRESFNLMLAVWHQRVTTPTHMYIACLPISKNQTNRLVYYPTWLLSPVLLDCCFFFFSVLNRIQPSDSFGVPARATNCSKFQPGFSVISIFFWWTTTTDRDKFKKKSLEMKITSVDDL